MKHTSAFVQPGFNFHFNQESIMKHSIPQAIALCLLALVVFLLCGCASMTRQETAAASRDHLAPAVTAAPAESPETAWRKARLRELVAFPDASFSSAEEILHYTATKAAECDRALQEPIPWTNAEREQIRQAWRTARKLQMQAEVMVCLKGCQEAWEADTGAARLLEQFRKLDGVIARIAADRLLWDYAELDQIIRCQRNLQNCTAELNHLRQTTLAELQEALHTARNRFENAGGAEYLEGARALYRRQDSKWFNWGNWRDDVGALYAASDLCQRIREGACIEAPLANQAAELQDKIYRRFSRRERNFYDRERRNAVPALADLPGYPQDNTAEESDLRALREFRKRRKFEGGLDLSPLTARN